MIGKRKQMLRNRLRWLIGIIALIMVLVPSTVIAQGESGDDSDDTVVVQVNRPLTVDADEVVDVAVSINDEATIDGNVADILVVANGTATVRGNVDGTIYVFEGTLILEDSATVNDVSMIRSDLQQSEGATISGTLDEDASFTAVSDGFSAISFVFRLAVGIAILLLSLMIMAFFGRPIQRAAAGVSTQPLASAVAGLGTWVALILIAIVAFVTIIGIPVSLGLLLVIAPFLALMGHIVASYWVGSQLGRVANLRVSPYLLFIIGLILVQLIGAIPFIGGLFISIVSLMGTGALVLYLWRSRQEPAPTTAISGQATV
jgi:hypothetical protein